MTTKNKTGACAFNIFIEDGEQVFPCRCGKMHRGDHAVEDWLMHECLHDDNLIALAPDFVACPLCGQTWRLDLSHMVEGLR